jgi:hypothetical protein
MLLDGLNEVSSIKNQLFKASTKSQTNGEVTEEPSENENNIIHVPTFKPSNKSLDFNRRNSKGDESSPGSETTQTTATMRSYDTFASSSPNDSYDFSRVSSKNKPARNRRHSFQRSRQSSRIFSAR